MLCLKNFGDFTSLHGPFIAHTWREDDLASPSHQLRWWVVWKAAALPCRSWWLLTPNVLHSVLRFLGSGYATILLSELPKSIKIIYHRFFFFFWGGDPYSLCVHFRRFRRLNRSRGVNQKVRSLLYHHLTCFWRSHQPSPLFL